MKHLKYIFSSLKNDFSKLFAIVLIVLLGIGFMSGLLQAGEDLKGGQNLFYKQNLNSDIRMSFSGGISKDCIVSEDEMTDSANPKHVKFFTYALALLFVILGIRSVQKKKKEE